MWFCMGGGWVSLHFCPLFFHDCSGMKGVFYAFSFFLFFSFFFSCFFANSTSTKDGSCCMAFTGRLGEGKKDVLPNQLILQNYTF